MAVFRTVQRFGVEASHDRAPPGDEVDHLTPDSNVVDDDGAHGDRDEKDEWPESRRHVRDVKDRSQRALTRSPATATG